MIVKLHTQGLQTFEQSHALLEGGEALDFQLTNRGEAYEFVARTLRHFAYVCCSRRHKGLPRAYLGKVTGLSRAQLTRLIAQYCRDGRIRDVEG